MSQITDERVREITARYEAEAKEAEQRALQARKAQSDAGDAYDRRLWERREQEAKEDQARARQELSRQIQQQAANNQATWNTWFRQSFANLFEHHFANALAQRNGPFVDVVSEAIALEREREARKIKAAVDEAKQWVEGKLETAERRLETAGNVSSGPHSEAVLFVG